MIWSEEDYIAYLKRQGKKAPEPKKSKYNNSRVRVDGLLFDSQMEADYYSDLKLQMRMGTIRGFCRQCEFILQEGFGDVRPITYRADFIVFNLDSTVDVIDTKGHETDEFKLKHKMFQSRYPNIDLKLVKG